MDTTRLSMLTMQNILKCCRICNQFLSMFNIVRFGNFAVLNLFAILRAFFV